VDIQISLRGITTHLRIPHKTKDQLHAINY